MCVVAAIPIFGSIVDGRGMKDVTTQPLRNGWCNRNKEKNIQVYLRTNE